MGASKNNISNQKLCPSLSPLYRKIHSSNVLTLTRSEGMSIARNATILKRFGYLLEILDIKLDEELKKTMLENISKGYSVLDPSIKSRKGKYNAKWKLLINTKIGEEF